MNDVQYLEIQVNELEGMLAEVIAFAEDLAEAAGVEVPWADDDDDS